MTIEARLENMQNQLSNVIELLQISISSLHTKKAVANFLGKSQKTIDNYIKNESFIKGKHYFINDSGKVEFIPVAIVEFKKNPTHKIKVIEKKEEIEKKTIVLSETSSNILKGIV
ncbi:hypothetical protein CP965_02005 [Halarcobacter mediterraneus]|uniref:Uncharacterized protein n=1 Tax=Halarcobacter mediterraneus TaxID=2023153 RepID=A0A4Q1AW01_9BACT|nr:hypothetical protein [Halarcobacter mediterraneus]RXK14245.1 hypothetical protein CP965_02005 [Halarcobacter mediterraneus]